MLASYRRSDALAVAALVLLPVFAHLPALLETRLLGPGDGVALHLPMRAEAWAQWRSLQLPLWNEKLFLGTPLLAAYRGGVLHPLTPLLAPFHPYFSFQALVLLSIALAGVVTFLYLKRLGCASPGAFVGALCFSQGPYLLGHLEDTATLGAAPLIPLVLLAAESHMNRFTGGRVAGLAGAVALLVLAGSPEALRAGFVLLAGRLLIGYALQRTESSPTPLQTCLAVALGLGLSAPQWMSTLELLPEAGRQATGLAHEAQLRGGASGLAALILRYESHTPAASLAIASLPLVFTSVPVRVLLLAVLLALGMQVGRGPLLAPGSLPLVVDFALSILGGIAMDAQWRARGSRRGRRLRAYFLVASLAAVVALSIAAATLGPLPERLSAAVGLYALALVSYFTLSQSKSPVAAGVFLLPLAVSFAAQPWSRDVWAGAPTREQLVRGTPARRAVDRVLEEIGRAPRVVTLVTSWPDEALDLGFAGYGAFTPRIQANGYDPLSPPARRRVLGEMGARGTFAAGAERVPVERLRAAAIDAVLVRSADLEGATAPVPLTTGRRTVVPVPTRAVRAVSVLRSAGEGAPLLAFARTASGRWVELGAGTQTWTLPGVYTIDGVAFESATETALRGVAIEDSRRVSRSASALAAYLSDDAFEEQPAAPGIRVFRVRATGPRPSDVPSAPRSLGLSTLVLIVSAGAIIRLLWRRTGNAAFQPHRSGGGE